MALKDTWNRLRQDLGRLLLKEEGSGYASDTYIRGLEEDDLPPGAYVDASQYGFGRRGNPDLLLFSAVAPFIQWKMRVYPDAMMALRKVGDHEKVASSPALDLLAKPNIGYDWVPLLQATVMELDCDGNSYWLKERANSGQVTGLYWVRRDTIEPDRAISEAMGELYYRYTPSGAGSIPVPATDVVHHRFGIDPRDHRLGISPLRSALRDLQTDELAQQHVHALLRNFAVAGAIVSVDGPASKEQLQELESRWQEKLSGRKKGRAIFVNKGVEIVQTNVAPKDMELSAARYLTEERMSALSGVPAIVAGVGAGLRRATYANFATAQKVAWQNTALPALRDMASAITRQLLPDFMMDGGLEFFIDTTNVAALQEDVSMLSDRLRGQYKDNLITRAEARADLGREVGPDDEVYYGAGMMAEEPMADAAA